MKTKKVEIMMSPSEIRRKYPIGSTFVGGIVVGYFEASPAAYMASFPGVVVEVHDVN